MKAILPTKSIVVGYLKPIHTIAPYNPICKPKCNKMQYASENKKET